MATIAVTLLSRDAAEYETLIKDAMPHGFRLDQVATSVEMIFPDRIEVLLADPHLAACILPQCHKLLWYQSTWAGNAPLMHLAKRDYLLTGVKGVFGDAMREFVFAYLLYFARNIKGFETQQARPQHKWQRPLWSRLKGKTLAILGAGSIARALLPTAREFGMQVIGLTRAGHAQDGYTRIYSAQERLSFAMQADYLVNLLPQTPLTERVIDRDFLNAMPPSSVLINVGRGQVLDDDALISALDSGHLHAAVLDVFRDEPLPDAHPFWRHERVYVTQHTAAISQPPDIAAIFLDNARRFANGQPLQYQIDFERGY